MWLSDFIGVVASMKKYDGGGFKGWVRAVESRRFHGFGWGWSVSGRGLRVGGGQCLEKGGGDGDG